MAGSGFLGPRGMRTCSQGKKVAYGRCGKAVETKAPFGHTRSIEVCVGVASPNRIAHDMPRDQSVSSPASRCRHNLYGTMLTRRHGCGRAVPFGPFAGRWVCTTDWSTTEPIVAGWHLIRPARTSVRRQSLHPQRPHRTSWPAPKVVSGFRDWLGRRASRQSSARGDMPSVQK